jgi:hypothetical protein
MRPHPVRNFCSSTALMAESRLATGGCALSKLTLIALCTALGLSAGQVAPLASMTSFHNVRAPSATEHVAYRRCWKRDGKRVCRLVGRQRAIVQRKHDENNLPPNLGPGFGSGM